jgi:cytochrome P450 family 6
LEKGDTILLSVIGLHHDAGYWTEPERFMASRPAFIDGTYNRNSFMPFLAGARMCAGARLAQMEIAEGLKTLLSTFRFQRASSEISFDFSLALRPASLAGVEVSRL